MKFIPTFLLYFAFIAPVYAQENTPFTVDAGVMSRNSDGQLFFKERGFNIPFKVGLMYGVVISSNTHSEFKCFIEVLVPSNSFISVNGDQCLPCRESGKKINLSAHEIERGMNVVKSETTTCKTNLVFLEKFTEKDVPGKRIIKYRINDEPENVIVFDVVEQ